MKAWLWNGTEIDLTSYHVEELTLSAGKFWRIQSPTERGYVLVKSAKTSHYCFVDQAKTVFGIQPYGCHYVTEASMVRILFPINFYLGARPEDDIIVGWNSFDWTHFPSYLPAVLKIILFRLFLGLAPNSLGHINVLIQDHSFALVPDYTTIFKPENSLDKDLTSILYKKIFKCYPEQVAACLTQLVGPKPELFHSYRYRLQMALDRVASITGVRCSSKIGLILDRIGIIYHQFGPK